MGVVLEIIVPVHNINDRRNSLSKLLSLAARPDTKFIIVSDSQMDHDHSEVTSIVNASLNSTSKIVFGNFGSPGLARNAGLSIANAPWISFLDSDDEIDLDALSVLISHADQKSAQLGIGGLIFYCQKTQTKSKYFMNSDISVLTNLSITPAFTRMVFRRSLLSQIRFFDFLMAEDQCFVIDVLHCNPKIHSEEVYFYTYNLGSANQSIKNRKALSDLPLAVAYIASQLKKFSPDIKQVAITMMVRQSATYLLSVGFNPTRRLFRTLKILTVLVVQHPAKTLRSLAIISIHRPGSFV